MPQISRTGLSGSAAFLWSRLLFHKGIHKRVTTCFKLGCLSYPKGKRSINCSYFLDFESCNIDFHVFYRAEKCSKVMEFYRENMFRDKNTVRIIGLGCLKRPKGNRRVKAVSNVFIISSFGFPFKRFHIFFKKRNKT